jgi:O-antigen/teichoic acid export membrane protein
MSLLRDSISLFINRVFLLVIVFATDALVSRYLGPEYKGYYVILYLTPVMLATTASLGLEFGINAVGRLGTLSKGELHRLFSSAAALMAISCGCLIAFLILDIGGLTSYLYAGLSRPAPNWVGLSWAIVPAEAFFILVGMLVLTVGRPRVFSWMRLVYRSTTLAVACFIYFFWLTDPDASITFLLVGYLGGVTLAVLTGLIGSGYRLAWPTARIKGLLFQSLQVYPARLAERLQTRINLIFLGILASAYSTGIYSVALGISESIFLVSGEITLVFFSRNVLEESHAYNQGIRLMGVFSLLVGTFVAIVASLALPWVYGPRFLESISLIWFLLPGTVSLSLVQVLMPYFVQAGRAGQLSLARGLGVICNILLCFILIPRYGVTGAALASSASLCLVIAILFQKYRSICGLSWREVAVPTSADVQLLKVKLLNFFARYALSK